MKTILNIAAILIPLSVHAQSNIPQRSEEEEATARAAESMKLSAEEVKRFDFAIADEQKQTLKLHPTPIYRYAGPRRGEVYANVFVWTHDGRPEVIASLSNWYRPRAYRGLAVTSLATEKLIGMRDGQMIWRPNRAGVKFRVISDVPTPGESALKRLREMRSLAREFTAEFKRDSNYPESGELRLLSKPIYRYSSKTSLVIDGALFGFASGTAPQLILLIEARQTATDTRWEYGLAPRNSTEYRVSHRGKEVWKLAQLAPPWPNSKNPTNTYTVFPDLQRKERTQEFVDQLLKLRNVSKNK